MVEETEIFEEDDADDLSANNSGPVPYESVQKFISELRESLRGDKKNNNFFRFLLEKNPKAAIEKSKAYLAKLSVISLLAIQRVIEKEYIIHETWQDPWEDVEPASEIEVTTGFEKEVTCYEHGILELVNKKTKNHLTVFINTETNAPFYKTYSIAGTGESNLFLKRVEKSIKKNNLYKNKTFTLEKSYNVGLIPKFLKGANVTHADVIIPSDIADIIQANVIDIFEREDEYRAAKIPLKRGILMEGPPGNGKTTIVKFIETRLAGKVTIIYVTDGAIQGASDIAEVYHLARDYAPSIVVLEDIDTIGLTRERGSNSFTSELLGQLDGLEELNGVVTLATTNHADLIDDALKNRPSRFDRRLQIPLPSEIARKTMLTRFLKEKDIDLTEQEITSLSGSVTKDFSGAMLKEVAITAKMLMVQNNLEAINIDTMNEAIKIIKDTFHDSKISSKSTTLGFRGR